MRRISLLSLVAMSWVACGEPAEIDGGATGLDAGRDAGEPSPDAGADSGAVDAGAEEDAGDRPDAGGDPCEGLVHRAGAADLDRTGAGFAGRPYHLHVPPGYDCATPLPALLVMHGGGSNAEDTPQLTCPGGDLTDAGCLNAYADREGFLVVYPNGTGRPLLPNIRTFNAGGGGTYVCVSGRACAMGIAELPYFEWLLDDLATAVALDTRRVYATGISNGAAMAHRLACEMPDRIAAIAPVAGGNQLETNGVCNPTRPVPVFAIHGTEDASWPYLGGPSPSMPAAGDFAAIPDTIASWETRHGCTGSVVITDLPDTAADGTTVRRLQRAGCAGVTLIEVVGGGHTWPGGFQYLDESRVGRTSRDVSANQLIWESVRAVSL